MATPVDDGLLALPPIMTTLSPPSKVKVSPSPSPAAEEEEQEPSTPTSEESRLRAPTECPQAPRKPPPPPRLVLAAGGKRKSSSVVFVDVPRDLSAVFRTLPPKKRIRAW